MDFGCILLTWELILARLNTSVWVEHVDSGANPTDGGSREGVSHPLAKLLGVSVVQRDFPPWPSDVTNFPAEKWLDFSETFPACTTTKE